MAEFFIPTTVSHGMMFGVNQKKSSGFTNNNRHSETTAMSIYKNNGHIHHSGTSKSYSKYIDSGSKVQVCVDFKEGYVLFKVNGYGVGEPHYDSDLKSHEYVFMICL